MKTASVKYKVLATVVLNGTITTLEFVGGIVSGSTALLSDALHNLSDTVASSITYVSMNISERKANEKFTFGYKRATILSAFINSSLLLVIGGIMLREGILRLIHPSAVKTSIMLPVSLIGLFANFLSVILLHNHSKKSLNIRSSYVHLLADTLSSIAVALSAVIMHLTGFFLLDSLISIGITGYIVYEAVKILKKSSEILMESSPEEINVRDIERDIESISGVKDVHHTHLWRLDEKETLFEAHINVDNIRVGDSKSIRESIEDMLEDRYGIRHSTIQVEHNEHAKEERCQ